MGFSVKFRVAPSPRKRTLQYLSCKYGEEALVAKRDPGRAPSADPQAREFLGPDSYHMVYSLNCLKVVI